MQIIIQNQRNIGAIGKFLALITPIRLYATIIALIIIALFTDVFIDDVIPDTLTLILFGVPLCRTFCSAIV